jgi:hypothetical protein
MIPTSAAISPSVIRINSPPATTYNHLLALLAQPHPFNSLHILHTAQNLMLHRKPHLDTKRSSLLDCKRLVLELLELTRLGQVNDDIGAALNLEAER